MIDWDESDETWYCRECDVDLVHGDYDYCPYCGEKA